MKLLKRVGFLSGAAALTISGGAFGDNVEDISKQELMQRLDRAESRLAELEAQNNDNWMTEQRADEMRNLVYDVLADADTRASLLQNGITAGYNDGAVLGSSDGNWLLKTNLLMQQRFIFNNQEEVANEDTYGFENTRTKFIMTGHVASPEWFYRVDINVGSGSSRTGTLNAYLGYDYGNGWSIKMGSMKTPLLREELVEAQYQLAVERSNVNYIFTGGYADGLAVSYKGDQFAFHGMFSDGAGTGQTVWSTPDTDYAFTARGEYLAMGNWDQFMDFTSPQGSETGVLIGGAIHYQEGESDTAFEDNELLVLTGDVSIEGDGWNAFGALIYQDMETAAGTDTSPWGIVVQGGFYITENGELFGRYEWSDLDVSGADDLNIFTAGYNHYFAGHNAKWTTDVGYSFDQIMSPTNITGYRADAADEDGQFVIRTQLQILF